MLRKEANNKDYADGGVTYRGKFPKVREKHGNMSRLAEVDDYEIEVEFAKSDMALTNRMENRGRLLIYVFSGSKKLYLLRVYLRIGDVVEPDTATSPPNKDIPFDVEPLDSIAPDTKKPTSGYTLSFGEAGAPPDNTKTFLS